MLCFPTFVLLFVAAISDRHLICVYTQIK